MDAGTLNLPAPAHPRLLGVPYHGLIRNGWLTLSNGRRVAVPTEGAIEPVGVAGDCYLLRVPGMPPVSLTPQEIAIESAAGREWRNYALLSGRGRNYGGITVGRKAWLYAAADGTVWRIECEQLDSAVLQPVCAVNPPVSSEWYYPATLDFTFKIRRFGLITPDGDEAALITRTVVGQSLGGAHKADAVFDAGGGAYLEPRDRLYPGNGRDSQWMPVAIEDVNSRGDRVILAVNRSAQQSVWNNTDYAAPRAWLEVAVSGVGESIDIQMSVLAVAPSVSAPQTGGMTEATAYLLEMPRNWIVQQWTVKGTGEQYGTLEYQPVELGPYSVPVSGSYESTGLLVAGAYYDADDAVQWVRVVLGGRAVGAVGGTGSNTVQYGATVTWDNNSTFGSGREYKVDLSWSVAGYAQFEAQLSASMGGAVYSAPAVVTRYEASQTGWRGGRFDAEAAPPAQISQMAQVDITGTAFGSWSHRDKDGQSAVWDSSPIKSVENSSRGGYLSSMATPAPRYQFGAPSISRIDNVRVVRVTHRVYAVIASNFDVGPFTTQYPTGSKVLALGTPNGWTTDPTIEDVNYATYNPASGQLAWSVTDALGWA